MSPFSFHRPPACIDPKSTVAAAYPPSAPACSQCLCASVANLSVLSFHQFTNCPAATPFFSQPSALPGVGAALHSCDRRIRLFLFRTWSSISNSCFLISLRIALFATRLFSHLSKTTGCHYPPSFPFSNGTLSCWTFLVARLPPQRSRGNHSRPETSPSVPALPNRVRMKKNAHPNCRV